MYKLRLQHTLRAISKDRSDLTVVGGGDQPSRGMPGGYNAIIGEG